MYSMPVIVAPAAAVGTGSCQTRVRLRLVSGLSSANASATLDGASARGSQLIGAVPHRRGLRARPAPPGRRRAG